MRCKLIQSDFERKFDYKSSSFTELGKRLFVKGKDLHIKRPFI